MERVYLKDCWSKKKIHSIYFEKLLHHCGRDVLCALNSRIFLFLRCHRQLLRSETSTQDSIGIETCSGGFSTVVEQFSENRKILSYRIFSRKNEKSWNFTKKTTFFQKFRFHCLNYNILNVSFQVPFVTSVVLDDTY